MTSTDTNDQREYESAYDHGEVVKYFSEKNFGFILPDFAEQHLYFHADQVHCSPALTVGERVTFLTVAFEGRRKAKRINRERAS
ncbi:MAG TPA: cold shock domain-containing protein [Micropepsaceae bacterium]|nr:cold shock domain-containing protein [Micropepsaceae bacterium]